MEQCNALDIFQTRHFQILNADMDKETQEGVKPNRVRQNENLSLLDGFFFHGTYYRDGQPQLRREKRIIFSKGTIIFNHKLNLQG